MFAYSDTQKIGVLLTVISIVFVFLGVVLFFDRGLLTLGNVLFLAGVAMAIGPCRARRFFMRKIRGSLCFFAGLALVVCGWTFIGMVLEAVGFFNLFGNFFPVFFAAMRRMPVVGPLLCAPGIRQFIDKVFGEPGETLPL
eukprot:m51a1_g7834 hypothetical protein (140) ;mRNA; f:174641-175411